MSGITLAPVPSVAVQVTVPGRLLRFVVFQTCLPAMALPLKATYAVFGLFGSMTARAMYLAGMLVDDGPKVTSVIVAPPLIVANTFPLLSPTMRTLSLVFEIPIALMTEGSAWLTTLIESPRLMER